MSYFIYVPKYVELEDQNTVQVRYRSDFVAAGEADTLEQALEIAVSVCRAYYGGDDPAIRLEMGARGTLTAIELYHPKYNPITVAGSGVKPSFPAAIIRDGRNGEEFSRWFAFPVRFYRRGISIGV